MDDALYGPRGFFRDDRTGRGAGGAGGHFRTSLHVSELFADALATIVVDVDERIGRPEPFDVVDIGAGGGLLVRRIADAVPGHLARRMRITGVEVAPRPATLSPTVAWSADLPEPGQITGVVFATEWLDNVPIDLATRHRDGTWRYALVDPTSGAESFGEPLDAGDEAWLARWWPQARHEADLGAPRDRAWAQAVGTLRRGLALTVDYGHTRYARPPGTTMTAYRGGRTTQPVPDGSCDLTAHVAIDSARAAGEAVAGQPATLLRQRQALLTLGLNPTRPPIDAATSDPIGYLRSLAAAGDAAELLDEHGLGGHFWLAQPVRMGPWSMPGHMAR